MAVNGTMCLKFIDTDQEKKISVGVSWPYEKLKPYECIISESLSMQKGVFVGDQFNVNMYVEDYFNRLRTSYN